MEVLTKAHAHTYKKVRLVGEGINDVVDFTEAWQQAQDDGLDLVLVGGKSDPPAVRIQDFKKVQYEQKKARKVVKQSELKEIQLKPNISDHDLATKISSINKFLSRGDKVKLTFKLRGRERENRDRAQAIANKVLEVVPCKHTTLQGPMLIIILEPVK